ncbi:MAG: ABC transporter permease [Clostridia bacterium]|nr:ABC transporter permease [Clostridia bacterium]
MEKTAGKRTVHSSQRQGAAKFLALPLIIWLAVFVIVPLFLVCCYGFTAEGADGTLHFSFENFARFTEPIYVKIMVRSLKIALISTVICLVLGYPAAYIMSRSSSKIRTLIILLILMPMWMNFMLRIHAWLTLLENGGLINTLLAAMGLEKVEFLGSEGAVVLGMVYNFLPFMIMSIYMVLLKLDNSLLEAAYDLGATPVQRFIKIIIPFSVPGILSGISMVFVPSVTTFAISQYFSNGTVRLIGDTIEKQFGAANNWNFGAAISIVVMVIVMLSMFAINKVDDGDIGERKMII